MADPQNLEGLENAVARIAHHAPIPEKPAAVSECLDEIESRYAQGRLDLAQKRKLVAILLGLEPGPAFPATTRA